VPNPRSRKGPGEIVSLEHLLHEQRLIKSRDERRCMSEGARISADAMTRAMQACAPGMNEAEITAELFHEYQRNGCPPAYLPIVAGGANALILHYISQQPAAARRRPGADRCRLRVRGLCRRHLAHLSGQRTFSGPQREVYDIVLAAQHAAIDQVRPGSPVRGLSRRGRARADRGPDRARPAWRQLDDNISEGHFRRFYMHKTGHWLGLDVHDVGEYRIDEQSRVLEKNMVVTVEPGLYIGDEDDIPAALPQHRHSHRGRRARDRRRTRGADQPGGETARRDRTGHAGMKRFDVVIVGGGLAGSALAVALGRAGRSVALIEAAPRKAGDRPSFDDRTLVVNAASLNILTNLGILDPDLAACDIRHIEITRAGAPGHLTLSAADYGYERFGAVIVARELGAAMLSALEHTEGVEEFCPTSLDRFRATDKQVELQLADGRQLITDLLVGADGTNSLVRELAGMTSRRHDYGQSAMIFNVLTEQHRPDTAFERFTIDGPLALLPQPAGRMGVVWVGDSHRIQSAADMDDSELASRLQQRFGSGLGGFSSNRDDAPAIP
jgi:hypothetical protein